MPWLSLIPWRVVGVVVAVLSFWGYGYYGGIQHEKAKEKAIATQQLKVALAIQAKQFEATLKSEQEHQVAVEKIRTITKTITRTIHDEKPSSNCMLSNGWVLRHNESITGTVPSSPSLDYANPSGVTADRALEQVAENYGTCQEIRQIAIDCQGWIREQQDIKK